MIRELKNFDSKFALKMKIKLGFWWFIQNTIFISFLFPSRLRVVTLRIFGATIGSSVLIRRGVRIHFPWNLKVGDNCWIGEEVWLINHESIEIGSNVCISQRAIICSSGHDLRSTCLNYKHKPIKIQDGAWICLQSTILAGSSIGRNSVVSAGETFKGELSEGSIFVEKEVKKINW
jgi:putative colanic acid biosynthesis acetyltransferase WcaF